MSLRGSPATLTCCGTENEVRWAFDLVRDLAGQLNMTLTPCGDRKETTPDGRDS